MNSHLYVVSIYKEQVSVNKGVAELLDEVSKVSIVPPPPPPQIRDGPTLPTPPPPKVQPFDKPLSESAAEGLADLFSGNVDDVTKTNVKLVLP